MTETIYLAVSVKVQEAKDTKRRISVNRMLSILGVSRSGYQIWLNREPSNQQKRKEVLQERIQVIYDGSHQNYGAPKIAALLHQEGVVITEKTVGNYMREMAIKAQWVKPYTITTRASNFSNELQNILNEQFNPERPNAVWCSDITYIWTADGFVYLTSIMDLYSRKIISWRLTQTLEVCCVVETINNAKAHRNTNAPLLIHSDRGGQYVSAEYQKATEKMQLSYSKKAYPWDNACIESFHAIIKREWLNRFKIRDYQHAYHLVFEYVEAFYNTVRIHSHCDYASPDDYEKLYQKLQKEGILGVG